MKNPSLRHPRANARARSGRWRLSPGVIAGICHTLENELAEKENIPDEMLAQVASRWKSITDHVGSFAVSPDARLFEVAESDFRALIARLASQPGQSDILRQLLAWKLEPVTKSFLRLANQTTALAQRLGRLPPEIRIEDHGVRIDPERMGPLFASMVHIVRSAVDHGIEPPDEREASKKRSAGTFGHEGHPGQWNGRFRDRRRRARHRLGSEVKR